MKILFLTYNYLNNSFLNQPAYPEIKQLKSKGLLCTKGIEIIKLIVYIKYEFQTLLYAAGINLSLLYVLTNMIFITLIAFK